MTGGERARSGVVCGYLVRLRRLCTCMLLAMLRSNSPGADQVRRYRMVVGLPIGLEIDEVSR